MPIKKAGQGGASPKELGGIKTSEQYDLGNRSSGGVTIATGDTSNVIGLHFFSSGNSLSATTGIMSCTEIFGSTRNKLRLFMMTLELPHMKMISFTVELKPTEIVITEITSRFSTDFGAMQAGNYELSKMLVIRAG